MAVQIMIAFNLIHMNLSNCAVWDVCHVSFRYYRPFLWTVVLYFSEGVRAGIEFIPKGQDQQPTHLVSVHVNTMRYVFWLSSY